LKELVIQSKKSILFLCTGNSCRSQIAEGFGKQYLSQFNISSAGTEAHGLNPNAIKTMQAIGIDISNQQSKKINLSKLNKFDLIITLCGDANDKCINLNHDIKHLHWDIKDPAKTKGNKEYILNEFSLIRDEVLEKIIAIKDIYK
jgi:arsenate reductase